MSHQGPRNTAVVQLVHAQFTGIRSHGLVEDILRSNGEFGIGLVAGWEEVDRRRGDDDLSVGVELGFVEVVDDVADGFLRTIPVSIRKRACSAVAFGLIEREEFVLRVTRCT